MVILKIIGVLILLGVGFALLRIVLEFVATIVGTVLGFLIAYSFLPLIV